MSAIESYLLFSFAMVIMTVAGVYTQRYDQTLSNIIYVKENKKYVVFMYVALCIVMSMRSVATGNDTISYYVYFQRVLQGDIEHEGRIEYLFKLFTYLVTRITDSFVVYQLILYLLCTLPIIYVVKKMTCSRSTFLLIMWFVFGADYFSAERQALARMLFMVGLLYLLNDRRIDYLKYIICILFASLFHSSAIVLLVFPLFKRYKCRFRTAVFAVIASLVLTRLGIIRMLFGRFSGDYYSQFYTDVQSGYLAPLFSVIVCLFLLWGNEHLKTNSRSVLGEYVKEETVPLINNYTAWATTLYACISIMSTGVSGIGRLNEYVCFPFIIFIVNIIYRISKSNRVAIILFVIAAFSFYRIYALVFRPNWNSFFPFYFFWQFQ